MRLKALQKFHDNNAAKHSKYYWLCMYQDITDYAKSYDRCQSAKRDDHPNITHLNPLPVAKIFERYNINLVGPLRTTSAGPEHILVCVDSFFLDGKRLFSCKTNRIHRSSRSCSTKYFADLVHQ